MSKVKSLKSRPKGARLAPRAAKVLIFLIALLSTCRQPDQKPKGDGQYMRESNPCECNVKMKDKKCQCNHCLGEPGARCYCGTGNPPCNCGASTRGCKCDHCVGKEGHVKCNCSNKTDNPKTDTIPQTFEQPKKYVRDADRCDCANSVKDKKCQCNHCMGVPGAKCY